MIFCRALSLRLFGEDITLPNVSGEKAKEDNSDASDPLDATDENENAEEK
jgi:hypothetical protein